MSKSTRYTARTPDAEGRIEYTSDEHAVWRDLLATQLRQVPRYACPEYLEALARMDFPAERIPQCDEVSAVLGPATGWRVRPVPALIDFGRFYAMLDAREFPAASFIRSREDFEYLQEPDIFHELFGHTPLLTDARIAEFTRAIGAAGLRASPRDYSWLARLYWFTVEFGLLETPLGVRACGAGLVSSISELRYAIDSDTPRRKPFDPIDVLRTPYRIDIQQPVYFVLDSLDRLRDLARTDLLALVAQARALGLHAPAYEAAA